MGLYIAVIIETYYELKKTPEGNYLKIPLNRIKGYAIVDEFGNIIRGPFTSLEEAIAALRELLSGHDQGQGSAPPFEPPHL